MKPQNMLAVFAVVVLLSLITAGAARAAIVLNNAQLSASLVSQNPDPARTGQAVEFRVMVENLGGGQANNVTVELLPSYPFIALPSEDYAKSISVLQGFQQDSDAAIVKFNVLVDKDAPAGRSTATLKLTNGGIGISATQNLYVDITSKEFAQVIFIDKYIISPGEETNLTFTVNNVGNSPLRNLVFSWNDAESAILPIFSDDTKYVSYLDVGGSVDLEYKVAADVNAAPGLYLLDLSLKYDIANGTTSELETKAGIFIGGETDFDVTYAESSSGSTSLSVANTGNNPAYSVTVRIPQQDSVTVSGSTSSIVGNLDKGDYTIVSFQLSSSAQAALTFQGRPGNFTAAQRNVTGLNVEVDYTDTVGQRHTVEKTIALQASGLSNSTAGISGFRTQQANYTIPIIVIVVVAAAGGYLFYRRRRKKGKAVFHLRIPGLGRSSPAKGA